MGLIKGLCEGDIKKLKFHSHLFPCPFRAFSSVKFDIRVFRSALAEEEHQRRAFISISDYLSGWQPRFRITNKRPQVTIYRAVL